MDLPDITLEVTYIDEPELCFGYGQKSDHPKDGLFLYGPYAAAARSREIAIGVVATDAGLSSFRNWAIRLGGFIAVPPPGKSDKQNRLHLSNFPGIEEAFGLIVSPGEFVEYTIDPRALDNATRTLNQHEAVRKTVDLYLAKIEHHDKNEEKPIDVWVLVLPEIVFERCKPLSRRSSIELTKGGFSRKQKTKSDIPLLEDIIDQSDEDIFDDVPDFHPLQELGEVDHVGPRPADIAEALADLEGEGAVRREGVGSRPEVEDGPSADL